MLYEQYANALKIQCANTLINLTLERYVESMIHDDSSN